MFPQISVYKYVTEVLATICFGVFCIYRFLHENLELEMRKTVISSRSVAAE
jgi:hypothetical protein